jgi:hypothetical protein
MLSKMIFNYKSLTAALLLFVCQIGLGQEVNTDSVLTMRHSLSSGNWLSGGTSLSFVSTPQNGASTLLTVTDGQTTYQASFGFIAPLLAEVEPNNAPISISPENNLFVADNESFQLQGYDPDEDIISYSITRQPSNGALSPVGEVGNEYTYLPSSSLLPGSGYTDTLAFIVAETEGEELVSEEALVVLQYNVEDQAHQISSFQQSAGNNSSKTFDVSFEDPQFNESYEVLVTYLDFTDPLDPVEDTLVNDTYALGELLQEGQELTAQLTISSSDFPYLFDASKVVVSAFVSTSTGFSDDDTFILENTESGSGSSATPINIDYSLPQSFNVVSEDGLFFTVASTRKTPENEAVELKLYAIELGTFDFSDAAISITQAPVTGSVGALVLEKSTSNLKQWKLEYTPKGEVGYLDSLQFSVTSNDRDFTANSYAKVEVVDVNDAPSLSAITNQETDEEEVLRVSLDYEDPDNEVDIKLSSSEAKVTAALDGDEIVITPTTDFNGSALITVQLTEKGTSDKYSKLQSFEVKVKAVNDQPIMNAIEDQAVDEDNAISIVLGATDADPGLDVFDYSVSLDDPSLANTTITGNQLRINPKANYNGSIKVTVKADDRIGANNSVSNGEEFTLTVNAVNDAPTSSDIPQQKVLQGFPTYTIDLGEFFDDVETADSDLTYTLGTSSNFTLEVSNDLLSITPLSGQLGTEIISVEASDGTASVSENITFVLEAISADIQVANDLNDLALEEDFGSQNIDLSNVFSDVNNTSAVFTYSISGLSTLKSSINGQTLTFSSVKDYAGKEKVYLIGTSDGKSAFVDFEVDVAAVNDAPSLGTISDQVIQEDFNLSPVFVEFADVDNTADDISVNLSSSNDAILKADDITVSKSSSGLLISASPVANANGETTIGIEISDGALTASTTFDLTINSVNDIPVFNSTQIGDATEDADYSLTLGTLVSDIDGDALTYAFEDLPSWLKHSSGVLSGTPSNDDVGSETFYLTAIDGNGGGVRQELSFSVINTNDAPTLVSPIGDEEVDEDVFVNISLDLSSFEDVDGDALTVAVTAENLDWLTFDATSNSWSGTPLNDNVGMGTVIVSISDPSQASVADTFNITVNNTNDAPTALAISATAVAENSAVGTVIGTLSTTDVDLGDEHSYSIVAQVGSSDNEAFSISGNELSTLTALNFEDQSTYSILLRTTDIAGGTFDQEIEIGLTDVNEKPSDISLSLTSIDENSDISASIAAISSTDVDDGDVVVVSLVDGEGSDDNADFNVENGELFVLETLDFETKKSYSLRLKATDKGGLTYEESFVISITDVNENPTDITISNNQIAENSEIGSVIGELSAEDQDASSTFTFELVSGDGDTDNSLFAVDGANLTVQDELDFETKSSYSVRIEVTDNGGASFEKAIAIDVTNVEEPGIADIDDIEFAITDIAETATSSFFVENTGDTELSVSDITTPDGFSVDQTTFTVGLGESVEVNLTFAPSEAKVYSGQIVLSTSAGETTINVTGEGTIITAIDDEVLEANEVGIYPNPARNTFTLDLTQAPIVESNLSIIDLKGKILWRRDNNRMNKVEIDISNYLVGTYLVRIATENGVVVKKLMIVK